MSKFLVGKCKNTDEYLLIFKAQCRCTSSAEGKCVDMTGVSPAVGLINKLLIYLK